MAHTRSHGARLEQDRRLLTVVFTLITALMIGEIIAGVLAGSIALLADAGHLASDALALLFALFAASFAARPARGRWTYGFHRLEILAAQANGLMLGLVGIWILYEAIDRLISPPEVKGGVVSVVALTGAGITLATTTLLSKAERESLNIRAVFLHVATDFAAFAGTALAGYLIYETGWDRFDPIASLLVAGLMFWASLGLLRETLRIFLEASPADIDPEVVGQAIMREPKVVEFHDLHVWTITSGFPSLSAHVLVETGTNCHAIRRRLEKMLVDRFGLEHTTLQVDHVPKNRLGTCIQLERRKR